MIILFVRHGDIQRPGNVDTLTRTANYYAKNLPKLIESNKYNVEKVYYDATVKDSLKDGKSEIKRCYNTVKHFNVQKRIKYSKSYIAQIFDTKNKGKTVLICFQSEHLRYFNQWFNNNDLKDFMCRQSPDRKHAKVTKDSLYENIYVFTYGSKKLMYDKCFATGTYKGDSRCDG